MLNKLKELMDERNFTVKQTAELLGISHSNMNRFLRQERTPCFALLVKMLYLFDCSADYLLGKRELPCEEKLYPVLPFHERLRAVMQERGISQTKMVKAMPVSSGALYKWVSGKAQPSVDTLFRLSEFLDCSIDYLIGRVR